MTSSFGRYSELFYVLSQEESIWEKVYESQVLFGGRFKAYRHPPMPQIPHWNLVYPQNPEDLFPTLEQVEEFAKFFETKHCDGNFLDLTGAYKEVAISHDEFFLHDVVKPEVSAGRSGSFEIELKLTDDFSTFSNVVEKGFEFPEGFFEDFVNQLTTLNSCTPSMHYLAELDGEICGALSVFETSKGDGFVMNGLVMPKFRGQGLSEAGILRALEVTPYKLLIHTNNEKLKKSLLPRTGFRSVGEGWVVPLKEIGAKLRAGAPI